MFLFAIPLGLGAGSVDAALNNFVALHYKARHMNWLHSFWGVGASAGPVIMSFFLTRGSWRSGYSAIGWIQTVLVVILIASMPLWKLVSTGHNIQRLGKAYSIMELIKSGCKTSPYGFSATVRLKQLPDYGKQLSCVLKGHLS